MPRPSWEMADIFRSYGEAYRRQQSASISSDQRRVMRAIEVCRTAALGGHVEACRECHERVISYNSCRNRHCPKCQASAKMRWLEARKDELLPVEYFHVIFTVPAALATLGLQNKRVFYNILFRATSQTLRTIASDPKHLDAEIGFMAVLHSWGQTVGFHPHLHCIVPGGGFSADRRRWISCRPGFFLPVRVLSRFFRRCFLEHLEKAHRQGGHLDFYGTLAPLADLKHFLSWLEPFRKAEWVVYAKPPFGGPAKVLDYLGRYTHRVAISNHRILDIRDGQVAFQWRDYRRGKSEQTMTLKAEEFIRRFLLHVLPTGFVRIRYFGFLSHRHRKERIEQARELLVTRAGEFFERLEEKESADDSPQRRDQEPRLCPKCGRGRLLVIEMFEPDPRPPDTVDRIDSS